MCCAATAASISCACAPTTPAGIGCAKAYLTLARSARSIASVGSPPVASNRDSRQRKRALHPRLPHRPEIRQQRQSLPWYVKRPSWMNNAINVATQDGLLDSIEPHRHGLEVAQQPQQQRSCRSLARNGDAPPHFARFGLRRSAPRRIPRRPRRATAHSGRGRARKRDRNLVTSASPRSARALRASTSSR